MDAKQLASDLGQPLDRRDTADIWRCGTVYEWSSVYESFLDTNHRVTIKPGISLKSMERELLEYRSPLIAIIDI